MVGIDTALVFLSKEYPAPKPDPAWITRCIALLNEHGHDPTTEAIHQQYLFTDLALSTLPTPPPFPPNKSASALHKITLFPKPTILQVNSLTEIASSAFQLQTVLEQRRDVLDGVNRIRQLDDPENGDNIEEEIEEGKLPNYPRGMLKLELGDGRNTIKAIEYRRLDGLKLGETELGAKILLHKVKVLRGILMLDPDNATVIGGGVEDMEVEQPAKFIAGLNKRLGKGEDEGDSQSATIQTALSHATDMKQERKPAVPPPNGSSTRHTAGPSTRGAQIPASRATQVPGPSGVRSSTAGNSRPTANLARSGSGTQSNDAIVIDDDDDDDDLCLAASRSRPQAKSAAGPSRPNTASGRAARSAALLAASKHVPSDDYDEIEANDSFLRQVDVIERGATSTLDDSSKRSEPLGLEDDFDDEYIDESFVRHIDEIEMKATSRAGRAPVSGTSTRSKRQRIVDSEEDEILDSDKENRYSNREVIELLSD